MLQASLVKDFQEKVFPRTVSAFEKFASENGTKEGWVYGKKVNTMSCMYRNT